MPEVKALDGLAVVRVEGPLPDSVTVVDARPSGVGELPKKAAHVVLFVVMVDVASVNPDGKVTVIGAVEASAAPALNSMNKLEFADAPVTILVSTTEV